MHKRACLCLFLIAFFAFANTLTAQFIADDEFVIVENDFYTSFAHLKYLFSKQYFMNSDMALSHGFRNMMSSGSVAYRPVLSFTYFIDYHFWKLEPLGYHLTNILLHILNVGLLYFCFWRLFKRRDTAFLGSLIFALHPIVSEAVSVIGFRADLVATVMVLASFLCFLHRRFLPSMLFYFLAVFAKESAIILPGIYMAYDLFYREGKSKDKVQYLGYFIIMAFYLFIYFYIFPNQAMGQAELMGGSISAHLKSIGYIFSYYTLSFFNPYLVRVVPPITSPHIKLLFHLDWIIITLCALGMFVWLFYAILKKQKSAFFLSWFFLALLPVSNVVPLLNPYANRFMYLPVIGLCGLLAALIHRIGEVPKYQNWMKILRVGFVSACLLTVIPMNMAYQTNPILARALLRDNPEDPMGYLFMGLNYMDYGQIEKAKVMMEAGLEKGLVDPRAYYILSWYYRHDFQKQRELLAKCIAMFPSYNKAFVGLARINLMEGRLDRAEGFIRKSLSLNKTFHGYHYLMQIKIIQDKREETKAILEEAIVNLQNENLSGTLYHLYVAAKKENLPLDIGF